MTHPLLACLACLPKVDYYTVASRRSCSRDLDKRLRDRLRIRECSAFADNVVFFILLSLLLQQQQQQQPRTLALLRIFNGEPSDGCDVRWQCCRIASGQTGLITS